jgi:hypothetical protein
MRCPRATGLPSRISSPQPTSTDRLIFMRRSSEAAFSAGATARVVSGHIQIANTWLIVNVGGGSTPDKPSVRLSLPADPEKVSSFLNIRVADIRACYELWKSRGAEFVTEPKEKYDEIRCYIRDPDG